MESPVVSGKSLIIAFYFKIQLFRHGDNANPLQRPPRIVFLATDSVSTTVPGSILVAATGSPSRGLRKTKRA